MATPAAQPLFFGPAERPRAGWLHRAEAPSRAGVVVCNPFGYEAICAHRTLRHLAEAMASAGIPALRFDYDGTGDSAGDDRDPGRIEAWVESVRDACRAMRDRCAVDRVFLVGVRFGALVAALAAVDADVAGLVAIAPVVSGKAYLRELALLQRALELREPPAGVGPASGATSGEIEALGFPITRETRDAIAKIDLKELGSLGRGSARFGALVLDREDLPSAERWASRLEAQRVDVSQRCVPGYVEMMFDPHKAVVPEIIVRAATDWIVARERAEAGTREECHRARPEARTDGAPPPSASFASAGGEARIGEIVERPVFVDEAQQVFGILSSPPSASSARAIVLLNAGTIHRIGPNRLYVRLARRWAAMGCHVLRMDLRGVGDSPHRPGEPENVVYHRHALEDVRAAVAFLRRQCGVDDVRTVGLCSGAYHAIKSAVSDPTVSGFVAINPLTFFPPPEEAPDFPVSKVLAEGERYQRSLFEVEKWKKLLRGKVRVRAATEIVARHAGALIHRRARALARRWNVRWGNDVAGLLEDLARRGVAQSFIFAEDDPGQRLLREEGGPAAIELQRRGALTIDVVDGPDHTFTSVWSHEPLAAALTVAIARANDCGVDDVRPPLRPARGHGLRGPAAIDREANEADLR